MFQMMELPGWTGRRPSIKTRRPSPKPSGCAAMSPLAAQGYNAGIRAGDILLQLAGKPDREHHRSTPRSCSEVGIWKRPNTLFAVTMFRAGASDCRRARAGPVFVLSVRGWHRVPADWIVCLLSAGRCATVSALLRVVSGLVRLVLLPLHRQIECLRSGDLLGQRGCRPSGSHHLSAFLPGISGASRLAEPARCERVPVRSGPGTADGLCPGGEGDAAGGRVARGSHLVPGPGGDAVAQRVVSGRNRCAGDENAACRRSAGAAAVEVHAQRRAAGRCAVHFDLRRAILVRSASRPLPENGGAVR